MSIIAMLMQLAVPILAFTPFSGQHLILVTYHVSWKGNAVGLQLSKYEIYFEKFSIQYPPYDILIRHPDGNLTVAGSDGEIINWVMSKINLTSVF